MNLPPTPTHAQNMVILVNALCELQKTVCFLLLLDMIFHNCHTDQWIGGTVEFAWIDFMHHECINYWKSRVSCHNGGFEYMNVYPPREWICPFFVPIFNCFCVTDFDVVLSHACRWRIADLLFIWRFAHLRWGGRWRWERERVREGIEGEGEREYHIKMNPCWAQNSMGGWITRTLRSCANPKPRVLHFTD